MATQELTSMLQKDAAGEQPLDEATILEICGILAQRDGVEGQARPRAEEAWKRFKEHYA